MTKPHCSNPRVRSEIRQRTAAVDRADRQDERRSRRGRLSPEERLEREMSELDLQRLLVGPEGLATLLGWVHVHFRPAKTEHGWRTPATGQLAAGWPDLTLVRERDRRIVFAELKRELEDPSGHQLYVLDVLRALSWHPHERLAQGPLEGPTVEVVVWRPSDLRDPIQSSRIYEVLR